MVFRAYNEGAAYRLETSLAAAQVKVYGEEAGFNFAGDYTVFYPQEESFFSHNERQYTPRKLNGDRSGGHRHAARGGGRGRGQGGDRRIRR